MIEMYSRVGCHYCTMAAELMRSRGIEFMEQKLDVNFTREYLLEKFPNARTFPVIVIDGYHIGGYTELVEHVKSQNNTAQLLNERV